MLLGCKSILSFKKKKSQIIFNSYSKIDFIKVYTKQISAKLDSQMLVHFGTENF